MSNYEPPKIWTFDAGNGGEFSSINRPTAGARTQKELPKGEHPFQLYSLATPNGVKVTTMFEELLALGIKEAEYDSHLINIMEQDQFTSGFVEVNPNSKIPALVDTNNGDPIHLFESGSILFYLAEKFGKFLPSDAKKKATTMNWLFWQMGSAPYLGGGFGHFYNYAPEKFEYPIDRFTMETKRQLDVLNQQLEKNEYIAGDEYTIADISIFPWYGALAKGKLYNAAEFLSVHEYKNIQRWADELLKREAVLKGRLVNKTWGDEDNQKLPERHSADDFKGLDLSF